MPSNFAGFDVKVRNDDRSETPVADATVEIYDAVSLAALDTVVADGAGFVVGGSVDVVEGTTIRFRVENHLGMSGFAEQVTT